MASLISDPPDYPYWRIQFYSSKRSPKRKVVYLKKRSHYGAEGYTKTEAKDWKKRRELAFKDGEYDPWASGQALQKESLTTLIHAKEQYMRHARRELADTTAKAREEYLNQIVDTFGANAAVSKVSDYELEQWINEGHLKYKSKMKRLEVVNALFGFAESRGWGERPEVKVYAKRAEKKRAKRSTKTWVRPEEYDKCKKAARKVISERMQNNYLRSAKFSHLHDFFEEFDHVFDFLINTALRRSDFLNLSTDWFIREEKMMRIGDDKYQPKSQAAEEVIPLTPEARQIARHWIRKYGAGSRPFVNVERRYFTDFFNDVFQEALPEKAHKLSAHKMRDSAAMYLLFEKGYSPQTVQQITRHEDLSTLNIYLHWAPAEGLDEIEKKG